MHLEVNLNQFMDVIKILNQQYKHLLKMEQAFFIAKSIQHMYWLIFIPFNHHDFAYNQFED